MTTDEGTEIDRSRWTEVGERGTAAGTNGTGDTQMGTVGHGREIN